LVVLVSLVVVTSAAQVHTRWNELEGYTFKDYVLEYNKQYDSLEYALRQKIFESKLADIRAHNKDDTYTWKKGVNQLTDWTHKEFTNLLGYIPSSGPPKNSKGYVTYQRDTTEPAMPSHVDWRTRSPPILTPVKDQGRCGSCWAFGGTETMESVWALKTGLLSEFSEQQVLSCTENPDDCGGTGGCGGGTAELAYETTLNYSGIASEWTYPYISYQGKNFGCTFNKSTTPPVARLSNYTTLPHNEYEPVIQSVVKSPVAIAVDASSWGDYESGIFNGCNQSYPHLDHIVQLVGYGTDDHDKQDFWIVRNSWAASWGEEGYIRLFRETNNGTCGVDLWPQDGVACNDGPKNVTVCGTCGILYDVAIPFPK